MTADDAEVGVAAHLACSRLAVKFLSAVPMRSMREILHSRHHLPQYVMQPILPQPRHRTLGLILLPG